MAKTVGAKTSIATPADANSMDKVFRFIIGSFLGCLQFRAANLFTILVISFISLHVVK